MFPDCALASTTSACIADSGSFHHDSHTYGECITPDNEPGYCQHIGLSEADAALEGALGSTAGFVWACGLLASAQSSTMTITYAGQFINDGFGEVCALYNEDRPIRSAANFCYLSFHLVPHSPVPAYIALSHSCSYSFCNSGIDGGYTSISNG